MENLSSFKNKKDHTKASPDEIADPARRKFMKDAAWLAGGTAAAFVGGKLFFQAKALLDKKEQELQDRIDKDVKWAKNTTEKQIAQYESLLGEKFDTPDGQIVDETMEKEIPEIGKKLSEILDFSCPDEVKLDTKLTEKIKQRWLREYSEKGKMHGDFLNGLKRMRFWFPFISAPFEERSHKHEVLKPKGNGYETKEFSMDPEKLKKFAYLAIPESHFDPYAESPSKALGAYQFIRSTAKHALIRVDDLLDERLDPAKSAEACANNITYLYNACQQNEDLASSGYNKHFIWAYLSQEENGQSSYERFLRFIQEDINAKKKFFQDENNGSCSYKIAKGDTLWRISQKFYCSVEDIKKTNKLKSNNIQKGAVLKIPLVSQKQRRALYEDSIHINGIIENLNYPAKFNAVMELVEKLREEGELKDIDPEYRNASPEIERKIAMGKDSLKNLAKNKEMLEKLKKINPHIKSATKTLPKKTNIYWKIPNEALGE